MHKQFPPMLLRLMKVILIFLIALPVWVSTAPQESALPETVGNPLKQLSLEELGSVKVTTASKETRRKSGKLRAAYLCNHA